jgi:predicted PurR-regulated permease PerM
VVPPLVAQTKDLIDNSDKYASELQGVLAGYGIHADIAHLVHTIPKHLGNFNGMLMTVAQVVFDGAIALATIVFVTIYMLSDQERLRHFFVGMFPERRRPQILAVMAELRRQVGGYVRGQLITSLLAGIFSFIVLEAAGVPNALALAGFAGIIDLVPMFGQMLGMIPAVGVALTVSPTRALIVLGGFVLYQQAENHFIVPRVYSNTMNVSPLVALVGLLIGAQLLGMLGMLVSLPIIASLPVILDFLGVHLHTERIRPNATADASEDLAVPG